MVLVLAALLMMRAHLTTLRQREEMRKLATTDALTGIANRRHLVDTGRLEVGRARRYAHGLSTMILDIDRFKAINDSWGHPTGDRAIQALSRTMQTIVRDQDMAGRLGGEEFAVILPETDLAGALVIAERMRAAVAGDIEVAADDGQPVRFTVSIGVAALGEADANFEDLLTRADRALYQAKDSGRNRVVAA
ncbi:GGDEF domain-containing protein [Paramagnetospirillum marisnigri]|uniref:GGDEF domain-containing protein n=1 Tax=Paramagnetospirillum marisnigri TaxID=1285242 RepID=UPI000AA535DB|nr:GGDEF domain-containing protein [Paramagnetospirillum marisnigri]